MSLAGRVALVTGAGNGLGRAVALALSAAGARTLLVGRNRDKLADTQSALAGSSRIAVADVSDVDSVGELRSELADEPVDILINNAGVGGPVAPLIEIKPDEWDAVFAANVRGVFLMCQAFLPGMIERGTGDVINIASVTGKRPLARRTPYAASKMAVLGLTRTLAAEVGPLGIAVNALSPGPVRGERMDRNFRLEASVTGTSIAEAERAFVSRAALNRLVEQDEVGAAVVAMLGMPGLCGADIDLSAGMIAP